MSDYVVGIDLGGTKVEACLMDSERKVLIRERVPAYQERGLEFIIQNIVDLVEKVSGDHVVSSVGMGTPGTLDVLTNTLLGSPQSPNYNIPGWLQQLELKLGKPLTIENDANCLAIAEYFATEETEYTHVLSVILGTGVGGGLILDRKLYRGKNGGASEFGHISIDINGRSCLCGRKGCVQAYLSGPAIETRYFEVTNKKLSSKEIYRLYENDDSFAKEIMDESLFILAESLGNMINVFDLDAIILGGGVSNMPLWYSKLLPLLRKTYFGIDRGEFPILKARLGDSAGVVGAAYLALKERAYIDF